MEVKAKFLLFSELFTPQVLILEVLRVMGDFLDL